MLNIIKIPICTALSLLLLISGVSADFTAAINVDETAGRINISGSTGENKSCNITIAVLKRTGGADIKTVKLYELSDKQKTSLYLREIKSEDGNFVLDFSPNGGSGAYDCIISCSDNEQPYFGSFDYVDSAEQQSILDLINGGSEDEILTAVYDNLDGVFSSVADLFSALSENGRKETISFLKKKTPFSDFHAALDSLLYASIIRSFAETNDISVIEKYEEKLCISSLELSKRNSDFKSETAERLKNLTLNDDFNTLISQAVYLTSLHKAENVSQVKGIMKNLSECGVNLENYFSLSDTSDIDGKLIGNYYTAEELSEFVKSYTVPKKNTSAGGGGGGGTGGSGYTAKGNVSAVSSELSKPEPKEESVFSDVASDYWAYASINALYKKGVVSGSDDGKFLPENKVTRREFVKIVINTLSLFDENAVCDFSDVLPEDWGYKYIASAYEKEIVSGKSEKIFAPDDFVTREEAAHILYKAAAANSHAIPKLNEIKEFTDDSEISEYARGSVAALCAGGIVSGYPDGSFMPKGSVTRGECAQLAVNMLKNIR